MARERARGRGCKLSSDTRIEEQEDGIVVNPHAQDDPRDVSSAREVRASGAERRHNEVLDEQGLLFMCSAPEGRRMMWRLVADSRWAADPFVPGNPDQTNYNCGRAAWGKGIFVLFQTTAALRDVWRQMQEEAEEYGW